MTYSQIKQLQEDTGTKRVTDLLALSQQNDPFYVGGAASQRDADWFYDLWQQFGYSDGVHLRRIHYQLVSQSPRIIRGDGKEYLNTDNCWAYLCLAAKHARYLGLVSPESFVDRKKPATVNNSNFLRSGDYDYCNPDPGYSVDGYINYDDHAIPELPEIEALPYSPDLSDFDVKGYFYNEHGWGQDAEQGVLVEVWIEKSTMNDVLEPICGHYGVNLVTGVGELSITSVAELFQRIEKVNLPTRILYISDFDPAGLQMPVSIARKIEFFYHQQEQNGYDIRLQSIALDVNQVQHYQLPRTPIKQSELRRGKFEDTFGSGAVELDALEALHPGELAQIVTTHIEQYYDSSITSRTQQARRNLKSELDSQRETVLEMFQSEISEIESDYENLREDYGTIIEKFNDLVKELQPEIEDYQSRMDSILSDFERVNGKVINELESVELDLSDDDYRLPEVELSPEGDTQLYQSERDYLEQLENYKQHKNGVRNDHK